MPNRKRGKILCEHEKRLVEAGLDEETAQELVDELEDELDELEGEEIDEDDEEEDTGDEPEEKG